MRWFAAAGSVLALLGLAHVGAIFGGHEWFAFLGAPDQIVGMSRAGKRYPNVVALMIALVCLFWASYAFSGAGLVRRLPFLRTVLFLIAAGMAVRAVGFIAVLAVSPQALDFICGCNGIDTMIVVTSGICLLIGGCIAVGLAKGVAAFQTKSL
jgi:putative oxidoreductase